MTITQKLRTWTRNIFACWLLLASSTTFTSGLLASLAPFGGKNDLQNLQNDLSSKAIWAPKTGNAWSKVDICNAISPERLAWFMRNFAQILIFTWPTSLVSHLIWATLFFEQSRIFKKWYYMFVYHLTKNLFMMKWSPSKGASMCKVLSNSETKNFLARKTPKGLAFKILWVHPKNKFIYLNL